MKKFFLNFTLSLIAILLFNSFYDRPQEAIDVLNYTSSAIYVSYSFDDNLPVNRRLLLFEYAYYNNKLHVTNPAYRINAFEKKGIGIPGRDNLVNQSPDKKIRLFFITEKTIKTKTWNEICKKKLYISKRTLSQLDLKRLNWIVKYP